MIPVTYPSSLSYRTTRQMVAYPITDLTGKRRWTDYIPVKFVDQTTFTVENSHNNNAYISVDMLSSNANLKEGIDYIPVYIDNAATDAWQVSATGYIPVGYSGAALSLQFAGSTFLDSRITFTRASSGTYFDNTGVLRRANRNLLTYSEQFDNATWAKTRSSISANAAIAPDGLTTADKLVEDTTASNTHLVQTSLVSLTTGAQTYSIYAKAAERTRIVLGSWDGSIGIDCVFNLNTGVVDVAGSGGTASITPVGNGWYRCSVSRTIASTTLSVYYYIDSGTSGGIANSYTGNGTSGIYIWGAQLEEGSTATQYAKTVASTSGAPRFDHDPVTKAPRGLLIEEQRTNLLTYSEDFSNVGAWALGEATLSTNATVAPDGNITADKLIENTANTGHIVSGGIPTSGQAQTFSVFAKAAERTRINLAGGGFTAQGLAAQFDLSNGTIVVNNGNTARIQSVGNGWYRCSISFTPSNTNALQIQLADGSGSTTYTGNGFAGVFIWGAQLENGSFATSYIPTVAAQVTRSADTAVLTGTNFTSWYRPDEGTMYAESELPATNGQTNATALSISKGDIGTSNNEDQITLRHSGSTYANARATCTDSAVVTQADLQIATPVAQKKYAFAYKANDFAFCVNASAVATDTSGTVPGNNAVRATIGANTFSTNRFNGTIRKIAFYPARLANAQLQALTS